MGGKAWRDGYMADMQITSQLFNALERGELCLRYEKICSAYDDWHRRILRSVAVHDRK